MYFSQRLALRLSCRNCMGGEPAHIAPLRHAELRISYGEATPTSTALP